LPENPEVVNGLTVEQQEPYPTLDPIPIFTETPFEPVPLILKEILALDEAIEAACILETLGPSNFPELFVLQENIPTRIKTHNERFKALVFFIIIHLLIRFKVKKNQ
jgi:hypothetical protein